MGLWNHLEKLECVIAIAESGSGHAASRLLHLTQPAISYNIKILEEHFQVQIFNRKKKGLELTSHGKMIYDLAKEIQNNVLQLKQDFIRNSESAAFVRIAAYDYIAFNLSTISSRKKLDFGMRIRTSSSNPEMIELLLAGKIDLAIMASPPQIPNIKVSDFFEEKLCMAVLRNKKEELEANEEFPLIVFERAFIDFEIRLKQYLEGKALLAQSKISTHSYLNSYHFIKAGLGHGIVPHSLLACTGGGNNSPLTLLNLMKRKYFGHHKIVLLSSSTRLDLAGPIKALKRAISL